MGTHANVKFAGPAGHESEIYVHFDGYPENMLPALAGFFEAVEDQCDDTRYGDPQYLAAKYVVHVAQGRTRKGGASLNFVGVGVGSPAVDNGVDHTYVVDCVNRDAEGRPKVSHEKSY